MFRKVITFSSQIFILGVFIFSSCRKDLLLNDPSAKLSFSTDTLTFDTVFTSIGSTTLYFKVFNTHNQKINISNIRLAGGDASMFRLNIDGMEGNEATDVEIPANDSIYIFVAVTVDPNNLNNPLVVYDSILFDTNGNAQQVLLQAWGQDAHFFYNDKVTCDTNWTNDKPYVIIGYAEVDTGCTLTIEKGCRIYIHAYSYLYINGGSLMVNGEKDSLVRFQGDRLEHFYDDLPGQWGGILIIRGSMPSVINYADINEPYSGIIIGSSPDTMLANFTDVNKSKITLNQCIIRNCLQWGIFSFRSDVDATNTLIYNCGENNAGLFFGGIHEFDNCTFANYSSITNNHQSPILEFGNFAKQNETPYTADFDGSFTNCIIHGGLEGELAIDTLEEAGNPPLNYYFDHCLIKTDKSISNPHFSSILLNNDPLFVDAFDEQDFHLMGSSACVDAGINGTTNIDLDGDDRDSAVDIGCYEYIP